MRMTTAYLHANNTPLRRLRAGTASRSQPPSQPPGPVIDAAMQRASLDAAYPPRDSSIVCFTAAKIACSSPSCCGTARRSDSATLQRQRYNGNAMTATL
jgi:hypothetical protein